MTRTFKASKAVRHRVPLLIGLVGPSGGGKTFSAQRLATGIQRVTGGDIYYIDTEASRALHYADDFDFTHVPFDAPFSPLDYMNAIEWCANQGAKVIVVDSMSHEHEGPGGVLEWHDQEIGQGKKDPSAWAKPKAARRRLINTVLQLGVNLISCFRAKEKMKWPAKGAKDRYPKPLGWMPIAGEEFVYEQTINMLLPAGAAGVPEFHPEEIGERQMIKLPAQFQHIFKQERVLSEEIGEEMARWAEGGVADSDVKPDKKRSTKKDGDPLTPMREAYKQCKKEFGARAADNVLANYPEPADMNAKDIASAIKAFGEVS